MFQAESLWKGVSQGKCEEEDISNITYGTGGVVNCINDVFNSSSCSSSTALLCLLWPCVFLLRHI